MRVDQLAELLRHAERIAVLSGAGLSKASGIPTYRDAGGLWTQAGMLRFSSIEEFERDPAGFLEFWAQRRRELARAAPNPGHLALAQLQRLKPQTALITQNVDSLLTKAGAQNVLEVHGNLLRDRCQACGVVRDVGEGLAHPGATACPSCQAAQLRPDVVMFGENLDPRVWAQAEFLAKTCEVCVLAGTSAVVYPAAGLVQTAQARGARIAVVNLEPTPMDDEADVVVLGRTEDVLPQLLARLGAG